MCKVMEYYENIAREEGREEGRAEGHAAGRAEERKLIAEEMNRKDNTIAQKDVELAALRAQLAALTQRA